MQPGKDALPHFRLKILIIDLMTHSRPFCDSRMTRIELLQAQRAYFRTLLPQVFCAH
jgi:hypothetical protein